MTDEPSGDDLQHLRDAAPTAAQAAAYLSTVVRPFGFKCPTEISPTTSGPPPVLDWQTIPDSRWTESTARPGVFLHQASGHVAKIAWRTDDSWVVDTAGEWRIRVGGGSMPPRSPAADDEVLVLISPGFAWTPDGVGIDYGYVEPVDE